MNLICSTRSSSATATTLDGQQNRKELLTIRKLMRQKRCKIQLAVSAFFSIKPNMQPKEKSTLWNFMIPIQKLKTKSLNSSSPFFCMQTIFTTKVLSLRLLTPKNTRLDFTTTLRVSQKTPSNTNTSISNTFLSLSSPC